MFDVSKLPNRISRRIAHLTWSRDNTGMSGSTILMFDSMVLKIEKVSRSSENERKLLDWLDGKLPVPSIIEAETQDNYSFLLMTKLNGDMASSYSNIRNIETTVKALANAMQMMWKINIAECPCVNGISEKLIQAKHSIDNNHVDTNDFEPETFCSEDFSDVIGLYDYLVRNRPKEDFVFSHGDFCLPNVLLSNKGISGLIDWGNGGVADRWQDIALCARSLQHNCKEYGVYKDTEYKKYINLLFHELGIEPDEDKIRYYVLLDELF